MKPIRLSRPDDPELARLWDEAYQHKLQLLLDDETRPVWEAAKRAAAEVAAWPAWKHTEQPLSAVVDAAAERFDARPLHRASIEARAELADDDCCVGDRSQCRCSPERGGWSDEDVEREKWIAVWNQTEDV